VDDCGHRLCGKIMALSNPRQNSKPKLDKKTPIGVAQAAGDQHHHLKDMKPDSNKWGHLQRRRRLPASIMKLSGDIMKVKAGFHLPSMHFKRMNVN
jgi:hypothetical protein